MESDWSDDETALLIDVEWNEENSRECFLETAECAERSENRQLSDCDKKDRSSFREHGTGYDDWMTLEPQTCSFDWGIFPETREEIKSRIWRDKKKSVSIEGVFVEMKKEVVIIQTKKRKKNIRLEQLSIEDQIYVGKVGGQTKDEWLVFFTDAGIEEGEAFACSQKIHSLGLSIGQIGGLTYSALRQVGMTETSISKLKMFFKKKNAESIEEATRNMNIKSIQERIRRGL